MSFNGQTAFNEQAYYDANPDVAAAVKAGTYINGYQHYILMGANEGRLLQPATTNGVSYTGFNELAYLAANPDVAKAVLAGTYLSGWQHYAATGSNEHRPLTPAGVSASFNEDAYLAANPDVAFAVHAVQNSTSSAAYWLESGEAHYVKVGQSEIASGINNNFRTLAPATYGSFSEENYLDANLDVAAAVKAGTYATGWQHYQLVGQAQGRALAPASDVTVSAAGSSNGATADVTYHLTGGSSYNYTITNFHQGDKINVPTGYLATATFMNDSGTDHTAVLTVHDYASGSVINITITGIDNAHDANIWGAVGANTAFGTGWIF